LGKLLLSQLNDMTDKIAKTLAQGHLVVMRSDTIYGIFASALNEQAVKKLHTVRERDSKCGFIVLVDSVRTAAQLIRISNEMQKKLATIWRTDSPTSIILPAEDLKEKWLADTRGPKPTICLRVPNNENLRQLLAKTGPLVAPSANLPNQPPAKNIAEARAYFDNVVALYVDGGGCINVTPSRIIALGDNDKVETIRSDGRNHPEDFVITRRRKLYKFAKFDEYPNCFHLDEWKNFLAGSFLAKERDIVLEVGAGSALFSVELTRRFPEKTLIAVDIKSDRLYQGAREAEKLHLDNIFFVRSDISEITEIAPPHSVSEIWLTFPDPWPPKSDARHRLTAPRYLAYYHHLLASPILAGSFLAKRGGILHFKTDNLPLFEWSLEQFAANGWQIEFITRDLHNSDAPDEVKIISRGNTSHLRKNENSNSLFLSDARIMTSYEKRFVSEGLKINYAAFTPTK